MNDVEMHARDWDVLVDHIESLTTAIEDAITALRGVVDLVGSYFDTSLAIVELKKGPVTANAFAQLMRYMRDFKTMLNRTLSDYYSDRLPEWSQLSRHPIVETNWDETLLQGILIGSGCSDENLMIACEACNIEVFHYTYSGGEYQFTHDLRGRHYLTQSYSRVLDVARDGIQEELNRFIDDRLEYETGIDIRQHNREFDATKAAEQYLNDLDGVA